MQHLLLLHGAIGARDQLEPLANKLNDSYHVHTVNFSGHGGTRLPATPFSISLFADDVIEYMRRMNIKRANIFGYSMGGYVGMYLAKHNPGIVTKLITLATKFFWDESIAEKEMKMLNPETILKKIPAFAEQLEKRHHPDDWKIVLERTNEMLFSLGRHNSLRAEDYEAIQIPCLLLLGDNDKMITLDETTAVQKALRNAQFRLLPAVPHPIEQVDINLLSELIKKFIN